MKEDVLGQFEQLILTAVLSLGEDAYGPKIHEKVIELAERQVSIGSVYITLDRLEDKGHLASKPGRPPQWGDRPDRNTGCALPASGHYGRRLKLRGGCNKPPDSYGNLRHESDSITEGSPASMDRSNCEVADATLCCGSIGRLEGLQPSRSATGLEGGRYHFGLEPDLDTTCL